MRVNPEILRLEESVPCTDCPLAKVCQEYDRVFADRGIVEIEQAAYADDPMRLVQLGLDAIEPGFDIETGAEISEEAIKAMRRGRSEQLPDSVERNIAREKFLRKRLLPQDVGDAYDLLRDKTAKVYTFGCERPRKRFKFFGKLGCGGLVLDEAAAIRRYETRARLLSGDSER